MLEENCPDVPHLQGADRASVGRGSRSRSWRAKIPLILDDGFQHRRLGRDLDIVLVDVDATCPWGHGWLFPRGLLREPVSSLRRAGAVLLTRCDMTSPEALSRLALRRCGDMPPGPRSRRCEHPARRPGSTVLEEQRAWCVRGVGRWRRSADSATPTPFAALLRRWTPSRARGGRIPTITAYSAADVEDLHRWAQRVAGRVRSSPRRQNDLVKLRLDRLGERELLGFTDRLCISGPDAEELDSEAADGRIAVE